MNSPWPPVEAGTTYPWECEHVAAGVDAWIGQGLTDPEDPGQDGVALTASPETARDMDQMRVTLHVGTCSVCQAMVTATTVRQSPNGPMWSTGWTRLVPDGERQACGR
jgi:hypothetical protein